MNEDDLVDRDSLNDIISIPSKGASGTSGDTIEDTIDYREWLPTWVAPGYYLKWVDIRQPKDQYSLGHEGEGRIQFTFIPKGTDLPDGITHKEFTDTSYYLVTAKIYEDTPKPEYMYTASEKAEVTDNGTTTDLIFEDRWDGYIEHSHANRSDPAKHSVKYITPYLIIASGGTALTISRWESTSNYTF